jgi:hypothetical protein
MYHCSLSSPALVRRAQVLPKEWTTMQNIVGGFAAGMFGAVFNTPGDVIRSAQQKQVPARCALAKFRVSLLPCQRYAHGFDVNENEVCALACTKRNTYRASERSWVR